MNIGAVYRYPAPFYAYSGTPTFKQLIVGRRSRGSYAGDGYIAGEPATGPSDPLPDGLVRRNNVPAALRVVLYDQASGKPVADTVSATDGTYRMDHLLRLYPGTTTPILYYAIAFDNEPATQNAGIQDRIILKQM